MFVVCAFEDAVCSISISYQRVPKVHQIYFSLRDNDSESHIDLISVKIALNKMSKKMESVVSTSNDDFTIVCRSEEAAEAATALLLISQRHETSSTVNNTLITQPVSSTPVSPSSQLLKKLQPPTTPTTPTTPTSRLSCDAELQHSQLRRHYRFKKREDTPPTHELRDIIGQISYEHSYYINPNSPPILMAPFTNEKDENNVVDVNDVTTDTLSVEEIAVRNILKEHNYRFAFCLAI